MFNFKRKKMKVLPIVPSQHYAYVYYMDEYDETEMFMDLSDLNEEEFLSVLEYVTGIHEMRYVTDPSDIGVEDE